MIINASRAAVLIYLAVAVVFIHVIKQNSDKKKCSKPKHLKVKQPTSCKAAILSQRVKSCPDLGLGRPFSAKTTANYTILIQGRYS